ncbi:MAG: riboflavin synthase [Bacteroidetes bacterium]|nr:riboflavin synthase [Bacteroidota bacterium]
MFTGIIEATGTAASITHDKGNLELWVSSPISSELKIDQSVSHNGICLTVVELAPGRHRVTAIEETLRKTNLGELREGQVVNIERCMAANGRFDGHIVQGHVDQTGECLSVKDENGSWLYEFRYKPSAQNMIVEKGSICINGVSLTAFDAVEDRFKVAIIPYTYEHTNIHEVKPGTRVNLEFDIVGKYVARLMNFKS